MGVVDDDMGKARRAQAFDVPDDERLAADLQQGFGRVVGERTHALAASGGKDHGGSVIQNVYPTCGCRSCNASSKYNNGFSSMYRSHTLRR